MRLFRSHSIFVSGFTGGQTSGVFGNLVGNRISGGCNDCDQVVEWQGLCVTVPDHRILRPALAGFGHRWELVKMITALAIAIMVPGSIVRQPALFHPSVFILILSTGVQSVDSLQLVLRLDSFGVRAKVVSAVISILLP